MKNVFTSGMMMLGLFATTVQAENVTPELTAILKVGVTQYEAESICAEYVDEEGNEDYRLPTIRELALDAIAREVLTLDAISETNKPRYMLVEGSDSAGNPNHFYFNYIGNYKRPDGIMGDKDFWSSSVLSDNPTSAYMLSGRYGYIAGGYRSYNGIYSVRCVR